MVKLLRKNFLDRDELRHYLAQIHDDTDESISPIMGGRKACEVKLANMKPKLYGRTRNHLQGDVTYLSPYLSRGVIAPQEVINKIKDSVDNMREAEKLVQELTWRDFWTHVAAHRPEWLWQDAEPYKTGWQATDYADTMPEDILAAQTDCACINTFIDSLHNTGYVHNHARMYLAAYVIHFRRVKWQVGAKWFLDHLLDGYPPSNNLSWQWVASTFSHKPYIFNLGNVDKYTGDDIDTTPDNNRPLAKTYAVLTKELFPNKRVDV